MPFRDSVKLRSTVRHINVLAADLAVDTTVVSRGDPSEVYLRSALHFITSLRREIDDLEAQLLIRPEQAEAA